MHGKYGTHPNVKLAAIIQDWPQNVLLDNAVSPGSLTVPQEGGQLAGQAHIGRACSLRELDHPVVVRALPLPLPNSEPYRNKHGRKEGKKE